jgi:hypothetical protein
MFKNLSADALGLLAALGLVLVLPLVLELLELALNLALFPFRLALALALVALGLDEELDPELFFGPGNLAPETLPAGRSRAPGRASALRAAEEFLTGRLSSGPVPAAKLLAEAGTLGIGARTLRRAKASLGVRSVRTRAGWVWVGPEPGLKEPGPPS